MCDACAQKHTHAHCDAHTLQHTHRKPQRLGYTALNGTSSSARSRQPPEPESSIRVPGHVPMTRIHRDSSRCLARALAPPVCDTLPAVGGFRFVKRAVARQGTGWNRFNPPPPPLHSSARGSQASPPLVPQPRTTWTPHDARRSNVLFPCRIMLCFPGKDCASQRSPGMRWRG
jgi:hypothetical protein